MHNMKLHDLCKLLIKDDDLWPKHAKTTISSHKGSTSLLTYNANTSKAILPILY